MDLRRLGNTGMKVSSIGFGAFKIGRNVAVKYEQPYDLPDDETVEHLLNGVLDLGITYIDTAPAYGTSEERIGRAIAHRRNDYVLSTKVGETFQDGESAYDFSAGAVRKSVERSLKRLKTNVIDIVFVHSDGRDEHIINETDVLSTLHQMREEGACRAIGFSGKTVEGARAAMDHCHVLMVEYNVEDRSHEVITAEAARRDVGVVVKKGLASGRLEPAKAIKFVLRNRNVAGMVVGSLNLEHIALNVRAAHGV